jgi:putative transposase
MVAAAIRTAFVQEDHQAAVAQWCQIVDSLGKRFPKLTAMKSDAEQDVLAFMAFPKNHWRQIHSTNPLERANKEIKRRRMSR